MSGRVAVLVLVLALASPTTTHAAPPAATDAFPKPAAGETQIVLEPEVAARTALTLAPAERAVATPASAAFGRVLDPLPFIEAVRARTATASTLAAARAEHARVTALHQHDENASTRDVEAAHAALERARADAASAEARMTLTWGSDALAQGDLDAMVDALGRGEIALARIDLPAGDRLEPPVSIVALAAAGAPDHPLPCRVLGGAPATDPTLQGQGYLLLLGATPPVPGTSLAATVRGTDQPAAGVAVPRSAVLWYDGAAVVYVAVAPGTFERRIVTPLLTTGDPWIVGAGVAIGEHVVVRGAQELLSAQLLRGMPGD